VEEAWVFVQAGGAAVSCPSLAHGATHLTSSVPFFLARLPFGANVFRGAEMEERLAQAIKDYRARYMVSNDFSVCLDRLEVQGFALLKGPTASAHSVRWGAASFIIHYVEFMLDDHRISESEMANIFALKRMFSLEDEDLLILQRNAIEDLLRVEMEKVLADERVDDAEAMHQSNLQRALGLGYDDYLRLTRASVRPLVERMLTQARNQGRQQQEHILRKLQGLQTVLRVDPDTMTAIWPD
jgi:hypothetical protein